MDRRTMVAASRWRLRRLLAQIQVRPAPSQAQFLDEMEARTLVPRWQVPLVMKGDSLRDIHEAAKNWSIPTNTGVVKPGLAARIRVEPIAGCTLGAKVTGCSLANDDLD